MFRSLKKPAPRYLTAHSAYFPPFCPFSLSLTLSWGHLAYWGKRGMEEGLGGRSLYSSFYARSFIVRGCSYARKRARLEIQRDKGLLPESELQQDCPNYVECRSSFSYRREGDLERDV